MKKKNIRILLIAVTILLVSFAIAALSVTALPGSVAPDSTGFDYDVIVPISSQDGLIEDELPSIGEITIGGNFSDSSIVSPNATTITSTVVPDGVYALRNVGNGQLWMGIERNYLTPGYHMQQYAFGYSPADNFTQAGLFKISKKPGTDCYIIRSMLNNLLSFGFSGNEVLTKTIPADDAAVSDADTFTIEYNTNGYVIKPYGSSYGVCANDTTASGAAGAPNSYLAKRIISSAGDQAIWAFEKYTGANRSGVTVKSDSIISKGFVVDTSYTIRVYTWTTLINANQPYAEIASSDSEIMTGVWNATTNAITITGKKVGKFCLYYRIRSGNNTVRTFYSNFLCIPPLEDGVNYFIQNVETRKYMDVEGPSTAEGAIIQQWKYSTANQKKWIFTRTTDGYFTIKSRYSNKYVGVDSTNMSVIRQYGTVTDYTKWYFSETDSGNYALHCKASTVTGVLASPNSVNDGKDLTTAAYTDDTNYRDEWIVTMLPCSGYEIEYDPSLWNCEPVKSNTNCYAYAFNNQTNLGDMLWAMQPGEFAGLRLYQHLIYEETVVEYVEADAAVLGFDFEQIGKYDVCDVGTYKVALVIDEGYDYHWYRQNPDGTWSHKPGSTNVINYDASNNCIFDPETADRDNGLPNYDVFVGFFQVTPINAMYQS